MVVVTSALTQVTNKLLQSATEATRGNTAVYVEKAKEIRAQHLTLCTETLKLPEKEVEIAMASVDACLATFRDLCQAMSILGDHHYMRASITGIF